MRKHLFFIPVLLLCEPIIAEMASIIAAEHSGIMVKTHAVSTSRRYNAEGSVVSYSLVNAQPFQKKLHYEIDESVLNTEFQYVYGINHELNFILFFPIAQRQIKIQYTSAFSESFENSGLGDIHAGIKYQLYEDKNITAALFLGGRLPTGGKEDPQSIIDEKLALGNEVYAILGEVDLDYKAITDMNIGLQAQYEYSLSENIKKFIPLNKESVIGDSQSVKFQPGKLYRLNMNARYLWANFITTSALYRGDYQERDRYNSENPIIQSRVGYLFDDTEELSHHCGIGIGVDTQFPYKTGKFPLPIQASIEYRMPVGGKNSLYHSSFEFIGKVYF